MSITRMIRTTVLWTMTTTTTTVVMASIMLQVHAGATTSSDSIHQTDGSSMNDNADGVFVLPMMGHKYVKERKLRELKEADRLRRQLAAAGGNNNNQNRPGAPPAARPPPPTETARPPLSSETNELGMSALYQGYGTHYVDLWVGTPQPQRQTVIVDTGSSITAFPCAGCNDCGYDPNGDQFHTDNYFDWHSSETFRKLTCQECQAGSCNNNECKMHMSYAEGSSWSAFEGKDYLYAGGSHDRSPEVHIDPATGNVVMDPTDVDGLIVTKFEVPYAFGCQQSLTGLFRTQLADGIMGMSNEHHTFWHQLYESGKLTKKLFSLCFSRSDSIDYEGTGAGAMTIGGSNPLLHKSPMVYVKETKGMGFFTVHIRNIFLRKGGGESAAFLPTQTGNDMISLGIDETTLNNHGVIFDSGTTDTYFTRDLAESFKTQWKQLTGLDYANKPFPGLTIEEIQTFPTVVIQLEGVDPQYYKKKFPNNPEYAEPQHVVGLVGEMDQKHPYDVYLAIPASHYFEYDEDKQLYTPRIYLDERSGSVLGANAMQGHDVLFDIEQGVIGIAESDCDYMTLGLPGGIPPDDEESERKRTELATEKVGGDNQEAITSSLPLSPPMDEPTQGYSSAFGTSSSSLCSDEDSMICKGALGIGAMSFLVGMMIGLPALRRWRRARSAGAATYDSVVHAADDEGGFQDRPTTTHVANDLRFESASIHDDAYLDGDDDMSDHPDLNTNYNDDDVGVEIMTSDRRSIV